MASVVAHVLVAFWLLAHSCCVAADPSVPRIEVDGVGNPVYLNVLFSYRFVQPTVQATFSGAITGDQAFCRLTNYSRECAVTDTVQPHSLDWASTASLPADRYYQRYPDLQLYPTLANAIAPIYNLNGISNLVLTLQTLAKIWSGRITTWDHPDIKATNPNFTSWNIPVNQSIALAARGDSGAITQMFKKVLGVADPLFPAAAAGWSGLNVPVLSSGVTIVSYVNNKAYTMGFASTQDALGLVPMVKLYRLGTVVEATTSSVQYAILEKGLSFGNNGDNPAHLTGDLTNSVSPLAWPFVSYSYIAVRKSTLRPDSSCATVAAMVDFFIWFWNSVEVAALVNPLGFSVLPEVVRDLIVARFKQDMWCGGHRVWSVPEVPVVAGYGPETAVPIFDKFRLAYTLVNSSVAVNYTALASDQMDATPLLEAGGFVVSTAPPSSPGVLSLLLGIEAVVTISMATLTLDGLTLARVLNGDITTWLHPDIVALNPNGIRFSGRAVNDTTQRIVLLQGPTAGSAALTALLQSYYPAYTGAAIQAATKFTREALLWSAVVGTPFSFSITALVGQLPTELQLAAIVASTGSAAVAPSLATARACVSNATYNDVSKSVALSLSNSSCYPLLLTLYVSMKRQCPIPSDSVAQAVAFLQWMFTEDTLDAALDALNVVSLDAVSTAILSTNKDALFQLSCAVHPVPPGTTDIVPLLLAIVIPIAVVLLIGIALCGWWLWVVTESNRVLRKKFSNDNVAESCAEAIARFDLGGVEWLKEVREPNKIQQSFLAIITLLTEVKPFIPDQLLSRLTTGKVGNESNNAEEEDGNETELSQSKASVRSAVVREGIRRVASEIPQQASLNMVEAPSPVHTSPCVSHAAHRSTLSSYDGARQIISMKDWRRKRCTYMCIRFGSTYRPAERRLMLLAQIAGQVVDIAKANGATIDAVGVDTANVHWGVTPASGASAARAVLSALEMMKLKDTLPEDQQGSFWLQMGIGTGLCDCGTVSSTSGHRFFVVWGLEASLAIEVAMANLPKRVLTSLLMTPAVYQEVQFTVQCWPRLWHGDVLLWEPVCVLKKKEDDEWMYELEKMNEGSCLIRKKQIDIFLSIKDKSTTAASLSALIAELREKHHTAMSPQDNASLDLLLATAGAQ